MQEFFDVYDYNKQKTGESYERGNAPDKKGILHLSVKVIIFNSSDEILIQQRQHLRSGWPDHWDFSAGGLVMAGEDSCQGARREAFEELGIDLPELEGARPAITVSYRFGFDDVYILDRDMELDQLRIQTDEVRDVRWASKDQIKKMIDDGSFIPYHKSYVDLLYDMRETKDVRQPYW